MEGITNEQMNQFNMQMQNVNNMNNYNQNQGGFNPLLHQPPKYGLDGKQVSIIYKF